MKLDIHWVSTIPEWLAEHVVNNAILLYNYPNWKALDPCCGSGTFLTILINKIVRECEAKNFERQEILREITSRVIGIDLNPLAVITARVNYFLNISSFVYFDTEIEIPVYSGDSAYTPEKVEIDNISFLKYSLDTEIAPFELYFPEIALRNLKKFSRVMIDIELDIISLNPRAITNRLMELVPGEYRDNNVIITKVEELSEKFVEFEEKQWNGIWARIITNYLTTMNIGKVDVIVGNPPWVDWKNLPSLYREKIKGLEITRTIFSGDSFTGGINLNIAALITNVAMSNWLSEKGVFGMLMPNTFLVQQTYEGYRRLILGDGTKAFFKEIHDWSSAGNPFEEVTQKFYTYYISKEHQDYEKGIKVLKYKKKPRVNVQDEQLILDDTFKIVEIKAVQLNNKSTNFTILNKRLKMKIEELRLVAQRKSSYTGREGVEVYPQELLIFEVVKNAKETDKLVTVENIQVKKSKFKIPTRRLFLEKKYLFPLIKGADIEAFHVSSDYIIPFVYDEEYSSKIAIDEERLRNEAGNIYKYFNSTKEIFDSQSKYSKKIINGVSIPYYSLARVGEYSFAPVFVAFRDNTKNVAVVVDLIDTPWGEKKRPIFQNHAVTISQRPDGSYISLEEAYYIAGIINSDIVNEFVKMSSDGRSYPINPRYQIPLYGIEKIKSNQEEISKLSLLAHKKYDDEDFINLVKRI